MTAPCGTARRYREGCGCGECRAAMAARAREVSRLKAYGLWDPPMTDAAPVRAHVQALMAFGFAYERIAEVAGVPRGTMTRLLYGFPSRNAPPSRRIRKETGARLLAVRADPALLGDSASVSACGTRRRLQALVACGWSMQRLAGKLEMTPEHVRVIAGGDAAAVTAGTARRVRDLYDRLWNQSPPAESRHDRSAAARARRHAERCRWAPPMAWDDDVIDDPAARPAARWKRSGSTRLSGDDVAELARAGATSTEIAERTGASRSAADRALARVRQRAQAG